MVFAVFGNPISHSVSPRLHNLALGELGLSREALYTRYELADSSQLISKFKELKLSGANVTVPHKETALAQCDIADETAAKIGSVNAEIVLEISNHQTITSIITKESAMQMRIGVGDELTAIIKASQIIIGV